MTVVLCACYLKVGDLGHFLCFIVNITIYGHGVSSALWSVFVVCISEKSVAVFVVAGGGGRGRAGGGGEGAQHIPTG